MKGPRVTIADDGYLFEVPLPDGWTAAYTIAIQRGRVVFGGMQVRPSGDQLPAEGVTPALLRRIPVGEHRRLFLDTLAGESKAAGVRVGHPLPEVLFLLDELTPARRKGVRRDERFYAEVARLYAALVEGGVTRPVPVMAEQLGMSPSTVTALVRDARARKLLTRSTHGRAGGRLTARAERILEREEES